MSVQRGEGARAAGKVEVAEKVTTVRLQGMSCASCAARIEKALAALPGVYRAAVNFAAEKATVSYNPARVGMADFVRVVKDLGYEVALERVELKLSGMSCASCAARIEKALAALPGVSSASVNFATERAVVEYNPAEVAVAELKRAVAELGYRATEAEPGADLDRERAQREGEIRRQKRLFLFSALFSLPLAVYMFGELLRWETMPAWLANPFFQFALATPVQFIAGGQFYRNSLHALKAGSATMDVLIALGTSAAYLYSTAVTFARGRLGEMVYFETAALIITLILLGRMLEAIAKGRTSEAIRKLMGLRAK
ncbi:MAG: copper ion binding protein, partial [Bacillota bacterium]|nr:copper ion binding protein [Bacillota bacterium]